MKNVLNLYAGIGGNRKLWTDVEVTAIELNPEIAKIYQDFFPDDKVIVADAHQYLLDHYNDGWDFIWSSPPCPTHSRTNTFLNAQGIIRYPDMGLYQEILFLKQWSKSLYVIENVIPYYEPLIKPTILIDRHLFWCNFNINKKETKRKFDLLRPSKDDYNALQKYHGFDLTKYKKIYLNKNHDPLQILRNCVHPELGLHIFNMAFKHKQSTLEME